MDIRLLKEYREGIIGSEMMQTPPKTSLLLFKSFTQLFIWIMLMFNAVDV